MHLKLCNGCNIVLDHFSPNYSHVNQMALFDSPITADSDFGCECLVRKTRGLTDVVDWQKQRYLNSTSRVGETDLT